MEIIKLTDFTFTYPNSTIPALFDVSMMVRQGEFITLCGKSGCGKTTLLRSLKPILAPEGETKGQILYMDKPLDNMGQREQSEAIGFVLQNPDSQLVTDKVWHELAFGLESLGYQTSDIRAKVAEMATFFGIEDWFHKPVVELSGGQKQLLNLAAVMVMQPKVLLLDEPTSQLDPISAREFLEILSRINRELGTTVLLSEHRLEEAIPLSDRVVVLDEGRIAAEGTPAAVGEQLKAAGHPMLAALPTAMRIHGAVKNDLPCPVTVREGRLWLADLAKERELVTVFPKKESLRIPCDMPAIELRDVWFRYEKNLPDVLRNLSVKIYAGELYAILGGNGAGKTTALSVMSGLQMPHRGKVFLHGKKVESMQERRGVVSSLPQNPQALFVEKTVEQDLKEMLSRSGLNEAEQVERVEQMLTLCQLSDLRDRHPYDLSGGEQQRAALAKILLSEPEILLLDEPTKGLDAHFKIKLAGILKQLTDAGVTIIMVSHDVEFCAQYADRCALFFDGGIVSEEEPRRFFGGKSFYTTAANRIARDVLPDAILAEDVISACGGAFVQPETQQTQTPLHRTIPVHKKQEKKPEEKRKVSPLRMGLGALFALALAFVVYFFHSRFPNYSVAQVLVQLAEIVLAAFALGCWLPVKKTVPSALPGFGKKLGKRSLLAMVVVLVAVPLTVMAGVYLLGDKKYYFISLLLILETLLPFFIIFEGRRPQARELVVISVLCAVAVGGRNAFSVIPQFKPILAVVIVTGLCFGGEAGFLAGALSGFVSNFFFGQGPWTPWQMVGFGMVGFLAGVLFRKGLLKRTRVSLSLFGGLATLLVYGVIANCSSVLMMTTTPTPAMLISACVMGFPFDLIHGASTAFFLWFLAEPMCEMLERIKTKYGILSGRQDV